MSLQLGDLAPDFTADSTMGPIELYRWQQGDWVVLFSHPGDFTPVCTTELGAAAQLTSEFDARGVKLLGLSVDSVESHQLWEQDIAQIQGIDVNFPVIADVGARVSHLYGMIHPGASDTATIRAVFVIDPDHKIQLMLFYPMSTGRNFTEILRAIDALQVSAARPVATPADWQPGEDVIISLRVDDTDAAAMFPDFKAIKPYLRMTAQPRTRAMAGKIPTRT